MENALPLVTQAVMVGLFALIVNQIGMPFLRPSHPRNRDIARSEGSKVWRSGRVSVARMAKTVRLVGLDT